MKLCEFAYEARPIALLAGERYWLPATGPERQGLFDLVAAEVAGLHAWLPVEGGLLANLRVWENCLLPLSYLAGKPDAETEKRFGELLTECAVPLEEQGAYAASPAFSLNARRRRLACVLRTLLQRPSLILVESEWFARLDVDEAERLAALFARECADACWLALGEPAPNPIWGFRPLAEEADHAVA